VKQAILLTNFIDGLSGRVSRTVGSVPPEWAYIGDKIPYEQNVTNGHLTGRIDHVYANGFQAA
jgi:hypothetical protein